MSVDSEEFKGCPLFSQKRFDAVLHEDRPGRGLFAPTFVILSDEIVSCFVTFAAEPRYFLSSICLTNCFKARQFKHGDQFLFAGETFL